MKAFRKDGCLIRCDGCAKCPPNCDPCSCAKCADKGCGCNCCGQSEECCERVCAACKVKILTI